MTLQSSGTIKMSEIVAEKGATAGSSAINISLRGLSVDGISDYQAAGSVFMIDTAGSPNQVAPYKISEFYGWSHTTDTTYYSSLEEQEMSVDTNVYATPRLLVRYKSGNIDVNWNGTTDGESPNSGTLVYQITNIASGYTVRNTYTSTGDGPYGHTGTIGPNGTGISIPTDPSYISWAQQYESGGGYDDEGSNDTTVTGSLIFEKSGSTTFTYSFTLTVELLSLGEGGL